MFGIDMDRFIERFAATKAGKEVVKEIRKEVHGERKRISFDITAKRAELTKTVAALKKTLDEKQAQFDVAQAAFKAADTALQQAYAEHGQTALAGEHGIAMLERQLRESAPVEIAERQKTWLQELQDLRGVRADIAITTVHTRDGQVEWRTSNHESIVSRMRGLQEAVREAENVVKLSPDIDVGPMLDAINARVPKIERPLSDYAAIEKLVLADMEQDRLYRLRERDAEIAEYQRKEKAKQAAREEAEARQRWQYHDVVPAETD